VQLASGGGQGTRRDFQKKIFLFAAVTKPVIAAVNGPRSGIGIGDCFVLRFAVRFRGGAFRHGFCARRGLIAEYGMAWMLPRLVGHANTLDLLFYRENDRCGGGAANGVGESGLSARSVSRKLTETRGNPGVEC